jgi:hypothetical protein
VPPETMICLRARKVRDCCCLEGLVSIMPSSGGGADLRMDGEAL